MTPVVLPATRLQCVTLRAICMQAATHCTVQERHPLWYAFLQNVTNAMPEFSSLLIKINYMCYYKVIYYLKLKKSVASSFQSLTQTGLF